MFNESPEYFQRKQTPFSPPNILYKELRAAVPTELFQKSTAKGLIYVAQDLTVALILYLACLYIDTLPDLLIVKYNIPSSVVRIFPWILWPAYWVAQSIALAGCWCLAHEAGHGNLSPHRWVNHALGYFLHTSLLTPYFAWRSTHHTHHKAAGSLERDENYVPSTRTGVGLPEKSKAQPVHYHEIFEETPLWTLGRMCLMQLLGWQIYLLFNTLGCPNDPPGTNHFSPSSVLFKENEYGKIMASNAGLVIVASILARYGMTNGFSALVKHYLVPYLLTNHWIVMITYLHHSDPTIPHYRSEEWTFVRGALATVDRPVLGWIGRIFFHNVSHDHIGHHLFTSIPFYNQPAVTKILKAVIAEHYNYDSTNSFYALYRSFTQCCFVEDEGGIVMYKDRNGRELRPLADARRDGSDA